MRSSDFGLITSPAMIGKNKPKPAPKPPVKKPSASKSGKGR